VLDVLVQNAALRDAFAARDRDRLQALSLPIHQVLKADHGIGHWNYIEPDTRRMFLRPHLPNKYGDVIERQSLLRAMSRLEMSAGKELGKSEFALRVGRPFFADGKVIGYIELGEGIGHFLGKMKAQTGNDFAMFVPKRFIDESEWARTRGQARNNWKDFPDVVVVNSTTQDPIVDVAAVAAAAPPGRVLEETEQGGSFYARGAFPVRDAAGDVVGGLIVRHDISALHAGMQAGLLQALVVVLALVALAAFLVYVLIERLIFRRLRGMMTTMEDLSVRLAGGDYTVGGAVRATSADEIGRFEGFFGEFLSLVANTLQGLAERQRRAAGGASPPRSPPRSPLTPVE